MPEMSKALCEAFNAQIQREFQSAYAYLNMSNCCAAENFKGTAQWLRVQWQEELSHAQKFIDFLLERGIVVELRPIDEPDFKFQSLPGVFETVLAEERKVTASIHSLYDLATAEKDFASQPLLQWFITEQIEEENSAQDVIDTLKIVGNQGTALLMVDRQLGGRSAEPAEPE